MPVDLSASIYSQYLRVYKVAVEAEQNGHDKEAANAYLQAADFMRSYAKYALDPSVKEKREKKADSLQNAARTLLKVPEGGIPRSGSSVASNAKVQRVEKRTNEGESDEFEEQIKHLITQSKTTWDDVAGMNETKAAIKNAYFRTLAQKPPNVEFDRTRGILLYGPPGTGKTMLAAATAGSLDATFFNAKTSDMLSKWFGESSQKVSTLFRVARKMSPSVIFFDEVDALATSRTENTSSANLQVIDTLLMEIDGLDGKDQNQFVLPIAATNKPNLLDYGILRRFSRRIYVPLPDLELRKSIFEIHLSRKGHKTEMPISVLAERSDGYSGDEISQVCNLAIEAMLQRMNPNSQQIVDKGHDAVVAYTMKIDTIQQDEFNWAFSKIKPVTTPEVIREFENWANNVKD